jgi:acyl-CoA hydrolase
MPQLFDDLGECVEATLRTTGKRIVLGLPLGIGKPNLVANEFFRRAVADPSIELTIVTALSLQIPRASSDLEQRLVGPLVQRVFGDYPALEYQRYMAENRMPANVRIVEFFLEPGAWLGNQHAQTHYLSANYTHVARDLAARGVNVIAHAIAKRQSGSVTEYSLGSNPDVTLDLADYIRERRAQKLPFIFIGAIHGEIPFMGGSAALPAEQIDLVLEHPRYDYALFAPPNPALSLVDHAIGLHASAFVRDGGTLQIGIGELGDSVCYALLLRHQQNEAYRQALLALGSEHAHALIDSIGGRDAFATGLFGSTEMLVDQMLDLYRAGILRRHVYDWLPLQRALAADLITTKIKSSILEHLVACGMPSTLTAESFAALQYHGVFRQDVRFERGRVRIPGGDWHAANLADEGNRAKIAAECLGAELRNGKLIHAGFFLGPRAFYAQLRALPESERALIDMRGVGHINQLDGEDRALRVSQRKHMRCINTTMMMTVLGAAVSDGLADGRVVSGVGGQYNFVAMAHALADARSILCLRSTRTKDGTTRSNIVTSYGHVTIPRHLRDIVITEYGIADLRGKNDGECIAALLCVTDSRFQQSLLAEAKANGKIASSYQIPSRHTQNLPTRLAEAMQRFRRDGLFSRYPFGTDLSAEEIELGGALRALKERTRGLAGRIRTAIGIATQRIPAAHAPYLARMGLQNPANLREYWLAKLVSRALDEFSDR